MDLVSVIIPCYNVSSFVDKLSWIFEQTYPELEVVLVDDCSTDDTWQKLQAFKQRYADQRIIIAQNEQNLGAGGTRNHGFALSSGQYVCFWDADDQAYPLFVEKMLAKLKQDQADFVCCGHNTIDSKGVLEYQKLSDELLSAQNDIALLKQMVFKFYVVPWNKLLRRDFIQEHGITFPSIRNGEDNCWTLQMVLNANKIAFIDEPYYQYYIDNLASLTHIYDESRAQCFWEVKLFNLEYIQKLKLDSMLYDYWLFSLFDTFLYTLKKMTVDMQKKFILEMRDYCLQNQIDLNGKDISIFYRFRLYRFLPNFGFFAKKREQMKREYYRGNNCIPNIRKTLALIKAVEKGLKKENARNGK